METQAQATPRQDHPVWVRVLAVFSIVLAIVTALPQWYYVFYYFHIAVASPHTNLLGQVWYWYATNVDQGALSRDSGTMAGAMEDAMMLGPLYLVTGIGLWRQRPWVVPVGMITGAMIFYAILYFILVYTFDHLASVTDVLTFWATTLPYLAYPVWLLTALLTRRHLFQSAASGTP